MGQTTITLKREDRQALAGWQALRESITRSSTIDAGDTPEVIRRRRKRLEKAPEEWFRYYFPNYCTAEAAPFHKAATRRLLEHRVWFETRAWSRELAKSARSMMEVVYLALTGQVHNVLLVSNSLDNACRLLLPIRLVLEESRRVQQDYGLQQSIGKWEEGEFVTLSGVSFRAIGAGQSPRGTRNEAARPDFIIIDDLDTDESCRNPERVKQLWQWVTEALIPAMSVSGDKRVIFNGNIIARDCIIERSRELVQYFDVVNIRDKHGHSTWPAKNSEEDIDQFLSLLPTSAVQKEFYNNPVTEGEVFTDITWDDCPSLSSLPFAICYGDPSPSNSRSRLSSYKAVFLVGFKDGKYYIYTGFLEQQTNDRYVQWYYDIRDYVADRTAVYYLTENNALQDPFWEQVLQPLFAKHGATQGMLAVAPDTRAKMDKYARIEGALEPLNRQGRLVFNARERANPHMQRLEEQFRLIAPRLPAPADGPDCIEGAVWQINNRLQTISADSMVIGSRPRNPKRW